MNKLSLNKEQERKLLEICEDLFPEFTGFCVLPNGTMVYNISTPGAKDVRTEFIYWLELCMFELPKRIAENGKSVLPVSTQYKIYESMSKRILNIHPTYDKVEPKHPVDYLYEEFKKT